ncbi:hypothetical protein DERF_003842 [Dermatophagoides farinae]|uniref:Uncharacterized protein n=1 Tax=Dermatophagoides farinae TaxID=6954 RepID=A0A922IFP5_DERFA|nr:hypothetical protein DERF_003842 [Dermatophagoides farinae]
MEHSTFYKITIFMMISLWTIVDSWPIVPYRYENKYPEKSYPEKPYPEMIYNSYNDHYRNRYYRPNSNHHQTSEEMMNKRKFREQEYEILDQADYGESELINHSIEKENLKDWFEPEAELIDSSKVSKDLRNVRFLRLINKDD